MVYGLNNAAKQFFESVAETLRPVLFVLKVMSNIRQQDCVHNKRIPQCAKMRIWIHHQLTPTKTETTNLLSYQLRMAPKSTI